MYNSMAEVYVDQGLYQTAIDLLTDFAPGERLEELKAHGVEWTKRHDILPYMNEEGYVVFGAYEQEVIRMTDVSNSNNLMLGISGGNDTKDRIFLLSVDELISHYSFNSWYEKKQKGYSMDLLIAPTEYAKQRAVSCGVIDEDIYYGVEDETWGGLVSENYCWDCIGREGAWWWLRSPGRSAIYACRVGGYGDEGWENDASVACESFGIRPALYISK